MGLFATVEIEEGVDLPHWPASLDRSEIWWQSKQGLDVYAEGNYRITEDGRLEHKKYSYREKTDEEKHAEAAKWGYDSWEEYTSAYNKMPSGEILPDDIDGDEDADGEFEDSPPTLFPEEQILDDSYWSDEDYHGTIEFHASIRQNPTEYEEFEKLSGEVVERPSEWELNIFVAYEARFTKGELDEIVLVGRHKDDPEDIIERLEEWEDE